MSEWTSMEEAWFAPFETRQQGWVRIQFEARLEMVKRQREANLHPSVRITYE